MWGNACTRIARNIFHASTQLTKSPMRLLLDPLSPVRFPCWTVNTSSSTGGNSLSNLTNLPCLIRLTRYLAGAVTQEEKGDSENFSRLLDRLPWCWRESESSVSESADDEGSPSPREMESLYSKSLSTRARLFPVETRFACIKRRCSTSAVYRRKLLRRASDIKVKLSSAC